MILQSCKAFQRNSGMFPMFKPSPNPMSTPRRLVSSGTYLLINFVSQSATYHLHQLCSKKRIVFSEIAKVFDALGWFSPVVKMKILLQCIWESKIDWDDQSSMTFVRSGNSGEMNSPHWQPFHCYLLELPLYRCNCMVLATPLKMPMLESSTCAW